MDSELDLDCGIAYERLARWLDGELALPQARDGRWRFRAGDESCLVRLRPNPPRNVGPRELELALERTQLTAEGDVGAVETFNRLFTLRFLSAGG